MAVFCRIREFLNIPYVILYVIVKTDGPHMNKTKFSALTAIILAALAFTVCTVYSPTVQGENSTPSWQLTITGLVEHSLNLTLSDIMAMPQTSESAPLFCVDFPNTIVTAGNWTGVKLSYLLQQANVSDDAIKVAFHASDGYSTDLSIQTAIQDNIILAYQIDGTPLTETLRLVVPEHWGYKWISSLSNIELVNYNYLGKWETNGYSDQAIITTTARGNPVNQFNPPIITQIPIPSPLTPNNTTPSPTDSALNTTTPPSPQPTSSLIQSASPSQTENQQASPFPSPTATSTVEPVASGEKPVSIDSLPVTEISVVAAIIIVIVGSVFALKKRRSL